MLQPSEDGVCLRVAGPIPQGRSLSAEAFRRDHHSPRGGRPVHFPGLLADRDVVARWKDDDFLKARAGAEPIDVYVSKDGAFPGGKGPWDTDKHRLVRMPFAEALERMQGDPRHAPIMAPGEKYYVYNSSVRHYAPLFAGLDVKDPMYVPDEIRDTGRVTRALWISEKGNLTPPHHDFSDNFLAQIRGRKRVFLWSPVDSPLLYINPLGGAHDRMSAVDVKSPDLRAHPRFAEAQAIECVLEPGDVVFIPAGWIHCIVTLDFSISANYWWRSAQRGGLFPTNDKVLLLQYLFRLYPLRPELRALVGYHLRARAVHGVEQIMRRAMGAEGARA
jgi:hypothetical protein